MLVLKKPEAVIDFLSKHKMLGKTIGFVPTMGALHDGHLSLMEASYKDCDVSVISIFVNPTQFNNAEDLKKYPRTLTSDLEKLMRVKCDLVYAPEVEDVYPQDTNSKPEVDISELNSVQEGKLRPGHFEGVVQVVDLLLKTVQPNVLYLGAKDYQQCMVIQKLIDTLHPMVRLSIQPTLREANGLAMSSRNMRLSEGAKEKASAIYKTMLFAKANFDNLKNMEELKKLEILCTEKLKTFSEPEYFLISNAHTLQPLKQLEEPAVITVATWLEGVRLIDNMQIVSLDKVS